MVPYTVPGTQQVLHKCVTASPGTPSPLSPLSPLYFLFIMT